MESFEDLELGPELVEALAAEGIEAPSELQRAAIPVIRRGHDLVAVADAGAGVLVAWGAALLDRLEPAAGAPAAVVIVPVADDANALAESLARLALATGHHVSALGGAWALPERSDIVIGTAADLVDSIRASAIKLDGVRAAVVAGLGAIRALGASDDLEVVMRSVPTDAQRVVFSLPLTPEVEAFAEAHLRRAVHVPPRAALDQAREPGPRRGEIRFRVVREPREEAALGLVAELLAEDVRHVMLFLRSEDRAADVGDLCTLHGFVAGAPGDPDVPVWLAVEALAARAALRDARGDTVARVSVDVPPDVDTLDRRHGGGDGWALVVPREIAHLKAVAREAGYRARPAPPGDGGAALASEVTELRTSLERALEEEDLAPYLLVLSPLLERHSGEELAAAATALLRRKRPTEPRQLPRVEARPPAPAWVRLFVSVGQRDDVGPGDLVGAITGETGVPGSSVGKIQIRDTFSLVEVEQSVADQVIQGLNGKTMRGRAVRVDFDRARGQERATSRGGRRSASGRRRDD